MEVAPKDNEKIEYKRNVTELGLIDMSYNLMSEHDNEYPLEELLIDSIRLEERIMLNNSNKTELDDENDEPEGASSQNNEFKLRIKSILLKILEKPLNSKTLNSFNALSFVLFVGIAECKDTLFQILEDLNIDEDIKMALDIPLLTTDFDYIKISQAASENLKMLINRSIDYSLQYVNPYCLSYIRKFLDYKRMTPKVKVDSIKLLLINADHKLFNKSIEEFVKIDCIILPNCSYSKEDFNSIDSLELRLKQMSQDGLVKNILRNHKPFEDIKRSKPINLDQTADIQINQTAQNEYESITQNDYDVSQKWDLKKSSVNKEIKGMLVNDSKEKNQCVGSNKVKYPFKQKVMEAKDILEVAFYYNLLKVDQILNLIKILYHEDNLIKDFASIYPVSLYKLLTQYECIQIYERLIEMELKAAGFNLNIVSTIITNSFNYAIFSNKMLLSAYIVKQHIDLMYLNKEQCIIGLLHIFNEYSEFNGSSTYHKGISHFEEILFHIEMMIKNFTYLLGEYFIESLENLLEVYNPNLYPMHYFPDKKQIIANHFLVWCKNPVKICVLIVYILKKLHQIFPDLKIQDITQKYLELTNKIIENCEGTKEVEDMFTDYCLNGYEVIDLICYENIEELLSNHSVGLIIADFWTGPFYRRTFLGQSTCYQILASNVFKPYSFYEYLPNKYEEIAKCIRGLHVTKEKFFFFQMRKSDQHSHFFKLEAWK